MDLIAREMVKEYGDDKVFNFSLGNPRVQPPKEYDQIMIDTINDHKTILYPHGYANNVGDDDAREAMAELFSKL
jgi:aspartate aminotransferase